MTQSPLSWMGAKSRIAKRIVALLPPPSSYDVWCDVFCGSLIVSLSKPPCNHLEVANDRNEHLVNFWMQVRDEAERLQWKLKTLPYAETVFNRYRQSLDAGEEMDMIEQACRWYYVKRCTIMGHIDSDKGWDYTGAKSKIACSVPSGALSYQNAVGILQAVSSRLSRFQIHACDFEEIIKTYQSPRTLLYIDPPYFGTEHYYTVDNTPLFTPADHRQLARLLNETPSMAAVSYYDCPELDEYYPRDKWRRQEWTTNKELSRLNRTLQQSREVLLMNYDAPAAASLWDEEIA